MEQQTNKRYQLRQAAGCFWLLDMEQDGKNYRKPVVLNESGARIWELLQEGADTDQVVEYLGSRYGVPPEQAREDVLQYTQMLREEKVYISPLNTQQDACSGSEK